MKKIWTYSLLIAALLALPLIMIGRQYPEPMYSPGKVIEGHSKLLCSSCHSPFKSPQPPSCATAECHEAGKIGDKPAVTDLHIKVEEVNCLGCHSDHMGRTANITSDFDHGKSVHNASCVECHKTDGKKAHEDKYGEGCKTCHTTTDWKDILFSHDEAESKKDPACVECHSGEGDEAHKDDYGRGCIECHTVKEWKDITFTHDEVEAKKAPKCAKCHLGSGKKAHKKDRYGDKCALCHTVKDWEDVTFDHKESTTAPCSECHVGPKDDLHYDAMDECDSCHTTKAWKPASLDHLDYFPLETDHKVTCKKCHDARSYKKYTCMNCHIHATKKILKEHRKKRKKGFGDCLRCHRVKMNGRKYGTKKVDDKMIKKKKNKNKKKKKSSKTGKKEQQQEFDWFKWEKR